MKYYRTKNNSIYRLDVSMDRLDYYSTKHSCWINFGRFNDWITALYEISEEEVMLELI